MERAEKNARWKLQENTSIYSQIKFKNKKQQEKKQQQQKQQKTENNGMSHTEKVVWLVARSELFGMGSWESLLPKAHGFPSGGPSDKDHDDVMR